jgi:hypothetical protein
MVVCVSYIVPYIVSESWCCSGSSRNITNENIKSPARTSIDDAMDPSTTDARSGEAHGPIGSVESRTRHRRPRHDDQTTKETGNKTTEPGDQNRKQKDADGPTFG